MGLPRWCASAAFVVALLVGCVAPHNREIVHPPKKPDVPLPANVYDTYFTPRGTEVLAPGYIAEEHDLFLLALQEIDNLNFFVELPGWRIKILSPNQTAVVDLKEKMISVKWRDSTHVPKDQMLPRLQELMDMARF